MLQIEGDDPQVSQILPFVAHRSHAYIAIDTDALPFSFSGTLVPKQASLIQVQWLSSACMGYT
jgi:hypothetical protein